MTPQPLAPDDLILATTADPADNPTLTTQAQQLASQLGVRFVPLDQTLEVELLLVATPYRLELRWADAPSTSHDSTTAHRGRGLAIYSNWHALHTGPKAGALAKQPIVKAIGFKSGKGEPLSMIDATAGWGDDAWLMASLGCQVMLIERLPLVACLLADALKQHQLTSPLTVARMKLQQGQAIDLLPSLTQNQSVDVIHLDPMFSSMEGSTALPLITQRKPMRLLSRLVGDHADTDAGELLAVALACPVKRVIVKRPLHGAPLANQPPHHAITSKASRYDVYLTR